MSEKDEGFTVIEVLCAFAILAVGLAALYASASTSLRGVEHTTKMQEALLLAHSKLDEFVADHGLLPASSSGTFPQSSISWAVTATDISPQQGNAAHVGLQQVHLVLSWPVGLGNQTLSFDTRHLGAEKPQ